MSCKINSEAINSEETESKRSKCALGRGVWAVLGIICFVLGAIGVVLPVLPTTPFILLAAYCFARSSKRLEDWFKTTKLYHKVLEDYVERRTMTTKAKMSILVPVSILMAIAAWFMWNVGPMKYVLLIVWLGHIYYFGFKVPTEG